jgi:hypothetical protein
MRKLAVGVFALLGLCWSAAGAARFEASFIDTPLSIAPFAFIADGQGKLLAGSFTYDVGTGAVLAFQVKTTAGTALGGFDYPVASSGGITFFGSSQTAIDSPLAPGAHLFAFFFQPGMSDGSYSAAEMACPSAASASCVVLPLRQGLDATLQLADSTRDVIDGATRWASVTVSVTPVPEPSTAALFGVALLGLLGLSRWRHRAAARIASC